MQPPPPPRPTRSTIVLGVIAMQCGQKTRNCEVLSFLCGEKEEDGEFLRRRRGRKK
jgi:hypothetical protein